MSSTRSDCISLPSAVSDLVSKNSRHKFLTSSITYMIVRIRYTLQVGVTPKIRKHTLGQELFRFTDFFRCIFELSLTFDFIVNVIKLISDLENGVVECHQSWRKILKNVSNMQQILVDKIHFLHSTLTVLCRNIVQYFFRC